MDVRFDGHNICSHLYFNKELIYKFKHKCYDRIIAQNLQKVDDFGSFVKHFSSANANWNFSTTPKTIMLVNLPNNKELCDYTGFINTLYLKKFYNSKFGVS